MPSSSHVLCHERILRRQPVQNHVSLCVVSIVCCCALPLSAAITDAGMFNGYLEGYGITDVALTRWTL
ncbi:MAG: hypothetical protein ACLUIR_02280 [Faecalibacterium prausnitzii]